MIHLGFTGTQRGMTAHQGERLWDLIRHCDFYAHHGCCVGADEEFDAIARLAPGLRGFVFHPCDLPLKQFKFSRDILRDDVRPIKRPLDRNQDIVDECSCMVATPKESAPQLRSGTWATLRRALGAKRPVAIILPSGAIVHDGPAWPGI